MTFVDPIGDMLTRIRNGQMRSLNKISIPFSVFRSEKIRKQLSDFRKPLSDFRKGVF